MKVFNEYKNKYYRFIQNTISDIYNGAKISKEELEEALSAVYMRKSDCTFKDNILESGFFDMKKDHMMMAKEFDVPIRFNKLELSYLKLFVEDERFNKILDEDILEKLKEKLKNVESPEYNKYWEREYVDKFGDELSDENLRKNIITLKNAIAENKYIKYTSKDKNGKLYEDVIAYPYKIEYSIKNDKYRLIIHDGNRSIKINIANIISVEIYDKLAINGEKEKTEAFIKNQKNIEKPLVLKVDNDNASLDRCLNLFSYYDKTYYYNENNELILNIYYYKFDEAEIILNILYLGKNVVVLEPESMRKKVIDRIKNYKFE